MCMDIMHFQPSVTLEFLLDQSLTCIRAWHSDVMKRYADYGSSDGTGQAAGDNSMYRDGTYKVGGGMTRHTFSLSRIEAMGPAGAAALQRKINTGFA